MTDHDGVDDVVGSLAEEVAKLFGAMSHDVADHLDQGSAECEWCPLCRTVRVVRDLSPEVKAHLAVAASSLAQVAAELLATGVSDRSERSSSVEDIDLDEDWSVED